MGIVLMGRDEGISIPLHRGISMCKSKAVGKGRKIVEVCINWSARDV